MYYEDISTGSSFAAIFMDGEELPVRMSYFCDKQHCETKTMEFETVEAAKLAAEMLV